MNSFALHVPVFRTSSDLQTDLRIARTLAYLMDQSLSIGPWKIGLDAVLGLFPVVGDAASVLVGGFLVYVGRKHGISMAAQKQMIRNLLLDALIGAVPVAGDIADAMFKANLKNLAILERELGPVRG
jgi:hypothetical protein